MSAVFVQAKYEPALARPSQEGLVYVTAWTRRGACSAAMRSLPASRVFSGEDDPAWPQDQVIDEHVAVRADTDAAHWTHLADVMVRSDGLHKAPTAPRGGALVACVGDLEARTCAIAIRDGGFVCFTARDTTAGHAVLDTAAAFAWVASFVHCRVVNGHGLNELRSARLAIRGPHDESITLIPSGRLADQE